ncbi:alpha/beta fold hydrolase [Pelagibacterium xiamenense]|uniref:alpha/beta fold hydrolase n=1 Tax=Pelagibacterium xiamenense TaxID=2901140 RepID=UPI001E619AFB|nr:alpha/beta fold hydrolase [Pelagibacterium xiamenense]MCD7058555.1 alpha/beta fold hydrolase [Pelagibacterium xiamenense]
MPTVTSKDGTPIGYETYGSGPAIVVVAGATQYRAVDQASPELAKRLADAGFTVALFDRRGRGESGDTRPYAVMREVEDIEAVIDALGGKASLYGMSSGAVLATEAAAALGAKVERLVCYEPPIDESQSREQAFAELAEMEALQARGDGAGAMETFMSAVGMPEEQLAGFKASPAWPAFAAVGGTIAHDYRVMAEATKGDMNARWAGVTQPALVVNGDASFDFMAAGADRAAAALPNATRKTLAGQGHGPDVDAIAPVLVQFLRA